MKLMGPTLPVEFGQSIFPDRIGTPVPRQQDIQKGKISIGESKFPGKNSMTRMMKGVRLVGAGVMMVGAWKRRGRLLPVGWLIILAGWLRGLLPKTPPLL